eukprot:759615-Prymnesium_polylepis.1
MPGCQRVPPTPRCSIARSRAIYHAAVMTVMPGQFVGQIIGYTIGLLRGHLWGVSLRQAPPQPCAAVALALALTRPR